MNLFCVLGIDVGDTTGMLLAGWPAVLSRPDQAVPAMADRPARLRPAPGEPMAFARAFQCDRESAPDLLMMILMRWNRPLESVVAAGGIEAFVPGPASAKLHGTAPGPIQAEVSDLTALARRHGVTLIARNASTAKNWATDKRLLRAGLHAITAGQPHARDGGRHMIYAAVHDCGLPDPLSRLWPAPAPASATARRGNHAAGP